MFFYVTITIQWNDFSNVRFGNVRIEFCEHNFEHKGILNYFRKLFGKPFQNYEICLLFEPLWLVRFESWFFHFYRLFYFWDLWRNIEIFRIYWEEFIGIIKKPLLICWYELKLSIYISALTILTYVFSRISLDLGTSPGSFIYSKTPYVVWIMIRKE